MSEEQFLQIGSDGTIIPSKVTSKQLKKIAGSDLKSLTEDLKKRLIKKIRAELKPKLKEKIKAEYEEKFKKELREEIRNNLYSDLKDSVKCQIRKEQTPKIKYEIRNHLSDQYSYTIKKLLEEIEENWDLDTSTEKKFYSEILDSDIIITKRIKSYQNKPVEDNLVKFILKLFPNFDSDSIVKRPLLNSPDLNAVLNDHKKIILQSLKEFEVPDRIKHRWIRAAMKYRLNDIMLDEIDSYMKSSFILNFLESALTVEDLLRSGAATEMKNTLFIENPEQLENNALYIQVQEPVFEYMKYYSSGHPEYIQITTLGFPIYNIDNSPILQTETFSNTINISNELSGILANDNKCLFTKMIDLAKRKLEKVLPKHPFIHWETVLCSPDEHFGNTKQLILKSHPEIKGRPDKMWILLKYIEREMEVRG